MRALSLILIALATSLSFGTANAEDSKNTEVVIVTAARPDTIELYQDIAIEKLSLAIDFSKLSIEAPNLELPEVELVPSRIDLALQTEIESKS